MGKTLFILRTFNDIDHISPVIWKFMQKGEKPVVLFHSSYNYQDDYRIQFLQREGEIEIYQKTDQEFERFVPGLGSTQNKSFIEARKAAWYARKRSERSIFGRLHRRFYFDCSDEMEWLRKRNITAAVFEWNSPRGRGETLERFFYAAKGLGIPTFSIPHGCNIYLNSDIHEKYRRNMARGRLPDFSSRNEFDYYVVQSRYHLEHCVRFGMKRTRIQAWGSTRFYPEWQRINMELCGEFKPQKESSGRLKVVFMLPHWNYNVDKDKTLYLLDELSGMDWIQLVIKDHTRGSAGLLPLSYQEKYKYKVNVEVNIAAHSPALIRWSDAVINFGSSIGLEALLQEKTLIYPGYLHSNQTIFDQTEAAIQADDHLQVEAILEQKKRESKNAVIPPRNTEQIYRSIIYGGKEPHDVLELYYQQIHRIISII